MTTAMLQRSLIFDTNQDASSPISDSVYSPSKSVMDVAETSTLQ